MTPTSIGTEPTALPAPISVSLIIKSGWESYKKRAGYFALATLLFVVISIIIGIVGGIIQYLLDGGASGGLGHILSSLITTACNVLLASGACAFALKAHDSPELVTFRDAWRPELFWKFLATYICFFVIYVIGIILLVVPGIIWTVTFGMSFFIIIDKGLGPIAAMKESARITKGNRWRLFALVGAALLAELLLFLIFSPLFLLGSAATVLAVSVVIILVLALIFVGYPVLILISVDAYRRMSAQANAEIRTPLSSGEKGLVAVGFLLPVIAVIGIVAAIMIAALSVDRAKGPLGQAQLQLKMVQLSLESYYATNDKYPASLQGIQTFDGKTVDANAYAYTTDAKQDMYKLCSTATSTTTPICITSDASSTRDVSSDQSVSPEGSMQ